MNRPRCAELVTSLTTTRGVGSVPGSSESRWNPANPSAISGSPSSSRLFLDLLGVKQRGLGLRPTHLFSVTLLILCSCYAVSVLSAFFFSVAKLVMYEEHFLLWGTVCWRQSNSVWSIAGCRKKTWQSGVAFRLDYHVFQTLLWHVHYVCMSVWLCVTVLNSGMECFSPLLMFSLIAAVILHLCTLWLFKIFSFFFFLFCTKLWLIALLLSGMCELKTKNNLLLLHLSTVKNCNTE